MSGLGWLPDKVGVPEDDDARYAFHKLGLTDPVPAKATLAQYVGQIWNQLQLGSCVTFAVARGIVMSQWRQLIEAEAADAYEGDASTVPEPEHLAWLALYWLIRKIYGIELYDCGGHIRDAFRMVNKFGFAPERAWRYSDSRYEQSLGRAPFQLQPPTNVFRLGVDQSSAHSRVLYRRIFEAGYPRVDACKRALANGYPVIFGTQVSHKFATGIWDGVPLDPPSVAEQAGGHAMVLAGYDGDAFDVVNSHGEQSGDRGWWKFTADYVAHDMTSDLWVPERAPLWRAA